MGRVRLALDALLKRDSRSIATVDDYAHLVGQMAYQGMSYGFGAGLVQQTLVSSNQQTVESIPNSFAGYARSLYETYDVVFACMAVRMLVFSGIRFQWRQLINGRPSAMFGTQALRVLERPWPGGTTQDLLARMIQDADLVGNSYWILHAGQLVRLRPDWTMIVLAPRMIRGVQVGSEIAGYAYFEGGMQSGQEPALFTRDEVAHFAPIPDPQASYRGMSWLTPILPEIVNDKLMQKHKRSFLVAGGTPNLVFSVDKAISYEKFRAWKEAMREEYDGPDNAYKKMFIGGGADVKVVGANMVEMGFSQLQGHTETRIAAAAGVPPIIVGLSEGLEAATYSNYGQARRRFADGTMHPLWQNAAGSLETLFKPPGTSDLWYDARDVPFLREDEKDASEILRTRASTIRQLVDSGFTPVSAIAAIEADDLSLLVHTGLFSVQLQKPVTSVGVPVTVPAVNGSNGE